jgi:hypothetical protein
LVADARVDIRPSVREEELIAGGNVLAVLAQPGKNSIAFGASGTECAVATLLAPCRRQMQVSQVKRIEPP